MQGRAQTLFSTPITPLQRLSHPLFEEKGIDVWVKRDDLNHSQIQGNKWHKLRATIQQLQHHSHPAVLTFGGAYSNHLAATAAAGQAYGFTTIGVVRGDELASAPDKWSHTLKTAQRQGMHLHFISRSDYRQKTDPAFLAKLTAPYRQAHPQLTLLPEGGTTSQALQGFAAPMTQLEKQCPNWTHLYTAVGTGDTLAGLVRYAARQASAAHPKRLIGVSPFKHHPQQHRQIQALCPYPYQASPGAPLSWHLHHGVVYRGYGRTHQNLTFDQAWWENTFSLTLDPIYTSRAFAAFRQDLQADRLPRGANVILYHSGGLQGRSDDSVT